MPIPATFKRIFCASVLLLVPTATFAGSAIVAVATNFSEIVDVLVSEFENTQDHTVKIVTGSTGKLYAQISNGAPFDVFLAADQERPALLVTNGLALPDTLFTYAEGQIALWSADASRIGENGLEVFGQNIRRFAIANPSLAPYGAAALEAMEKLNVYSHVESDIVMGENIGQAHALIASGNAEVGIVALSYALSPRNENKGSYWSIPSDLYTPIKQDAVVIKRAEDNAAALAFVEYLESEDAKLIIREHGYEVE